MKTFLRSPWLWAVIGVSLFVLIFSISPAFNECVEKIQKAHSEKPSVEKPRGLPSLTHVDCFASAVYDGHGILTALATIVLAVFTWLLARITSDLHKMAKTQDETSKKQQRAYIVCGGLFGVPNNEKPALREIHRPKASDYGPQWRMAIYNYGRTPGYITKIQWGECLENEFPTDTLVSEIIESKRFLIKSPQPVQEVVAPTGSRPLHYRHVTPDRKVGMVFFGRIDYDDVFGESHHSTFALLHREEHTDTIGESYSKDWK